MAQIEWDENKRLSNLRKHGLDFENADWVLQNSYRLDIQSTRQGEVRTQSFAYVFGELMVLTLIHTNREGAARIISFRPASPKESETYYDWLANSF